MNTVLTEEERALQMIYKEYADERIRWRSTRGFSALNRC